MHADAILDRSLLAHDLPFNTVNAVQLSPLHEQWESNFLMIICFFLCDLTLDHPPLESRGSVPR
jgi:hypothetical protein